MYGFVDTIPGSAGSTSMSLQTVFNGINLDESLTDAEGEFITLTVSGRGNTVVKRSIIPVPGMHGAWEDEEGYLEPRSITVKFKIKDATNEGMRERQDKLNTLIEGTKRVLSFTDEENIFYASVQELEIPEEETNDLVGYLHFICSDPFKYGPEKLYTFPTDIVTINNQGTAEADPIFTMNVKEPTTFAMISNGEEYMMVGRPYDVSDDEPYQKYERIFYSDASSTVGWTNGTDVDGGVVAGTMQSNGTRLEASSYGSGTRWHGPAIKRSMPEVVSDFRFQAFVALFNQNVAAYVGRIEIYLLDTVGNTVAKLAIKDTQSAQSLGFAEIRAGDMNNHHFLINEYGDRPGNWNNFNGILRVEREGNEWYAYVAMVDTTTRRHHTRRSVRWIDTNNRFTRNVAQVQVHVGQFGSHQTTAGGVYSMTLEKINQETNGVPYIADAGDEIVFDHVTGDAYINGESVPFDMGADFFKLAKGGNGLAVLPENTFETNVKFRERYR